MNKLTDKLPVAPASDDRPKSNTLFDQLRNSIRNSVSKIIAALRRSDILQPLHKRYGPVKYGYVLPAYQKVRRFFSPELRDDISYQLWAARSEATRYDRERATRYIDRFTYKPTISIILPVYNTRAEYLRKALDSVLDQYYSNWELCVADDASSAPHVRQILSEYSTKDDRIKVIYSEINGGIAKASNRALKLASGEFIGLLDHDDQLTPDALYEVAATLQEAEADLIYTDEDRLDSTGMRVEPAFKPAWSPDLLLSCMYMAHFCVYRKSIVDRLGGFRKGFDGSQDYDLALRFTEESSRIAHIPRILYHWRKVPASASSLPEAKASVTEAGRRALTDALDRRNIKGEVESERFFGFYRVRRRVSGSEKVSIIIPTRDGFENLRRSVLSIESKTDYSNYEIIIVDNGSRKAAMLDYLKRSPHRVIRHDGGFSFSRLNNLAAREARGDYLLFLNDDTEVISNEWLRAMIEQAARPEVGAVGAKLLYRDARLQHAGIILGVRGAAGHAHRYIDGFSGRGYLNYPNVIRNYSAVTAACLMTRRELFDKAGGFDEQSLAVSYNDVDYCLRLRAQKYLIVFTPYALLYHDESATRGLNLYPEEEACIISRWQNAIARDYYYNPNLGSDKEDFSMDFSRPESLEQFRMASA
ncbi:MAG: glycosyltransferase family 2 protein [Blastocatellia bacterium]